jgi:crossover junction endodeoxyribonuclease RuvC
MIKTIVGIDPGSQFLGVGCVQKVGATIRYRYAEVLTAKKKDTLYPRLEVILARLEILLDELKPDEVAVEDLFHALNARSAFHLGMARGVAIGACLRRGIPIFEYAPTQIKAVVTGHGRSDKAQVKKMVELTLGQRLDVGFDATDALAVAICHSATHRFEVPKSSLPRTRGL